MGKKKETEEAPKLGADLQKQKESGRRLRYEAEERARLRERTFVNSHSSDEAEGELPPLEWLASGLGWFATGFVTKAEGDATGKTKEEILREGTLLEKLRLYYSSADLNGYFEGMDKTLTPLEVEVIRDSIRENSEDIELVAKCEKEYFTITDYGKELSYYYKRFQSIFGMLAVLLNRWDEYEKTAALLSDIFNENYQDPIVDYIDADKYPYEPPVFWAEDRERFYSPEKIRAFLEKKARYSYLDGATLYIDKGFCGFKVNVDGKGGLYAQIKMAAKEAAEALNDFKAYAKAAEEYIDASTLRYTPISILMSIENAESERYTRYLVRNPVYFRSELNQRRAKGETITPEDEKRAVIPDYYDSKPTAKIYRDCRKGIKAIEREKAANIK